MRLRISLTGLVVVVVLAVLLWPAPPAEDRWDFTLEIPYTDRGNPFAEERLARRLRHIATLVSDVVGTEVRVNELNLVLRDADAAAEQDTRESYPRLTDPSSEEYESVQVLLARLTSEDQWRSYLGRYAPEVKTIELYPFAFEAVLETARGVVGLADLIDVVLAHELAHVWQDQRYGLFEHEGVEDANEITLARAAVLEGSAEFIARAVAKKLGVSEAFDFVAATREEDAQNATGTAVQRVLARWLLWVYGDGLRFIDTVLWTRGPAGLWDVVFGNLPTSVWSIEHPHQWLARRGTPVTNLDTWAERFIWAQQAVPARSKIRPTWGHLPRLREDLEERLSKAELAPYAAPWSKCSGGIILAGEPKRGPLAGEDLAVEVWRFPTAELAEQARRSLEAALDALGPRAWAGKDSVERAIGRARVRSGLGGSRAHSSLVFDDAPLHAHEGTWAVRVEENLLFEVECWRDGAAPALLDVLDRAVLALHTAEAIDAARAGTPPPGSPWGALAALRDGNPTELDSPDLGDPGALRDEVLTRWLARPTGNAEVLAWLQERSTETAAWLTALGPAAGREDEEGVERGDLLAAALDHPDDDVVRFALGALAEGRCVPGPWSAQLLGQIKRLSDHADAWIRSVAVRAAEALHEEQLLEVDRIDALAADPSPAVRATLATCHELLMRRPRRVRETLAEDSDAAVRRAASAEEPGDETNWFMKLVNRRIGRDDGADEDRERPAAGELMLDAMLDSGSEKKREWFTKHVRHYLDAGSEAERLLALKAVESMGEGRAAFVPDLVRAFDSAWPRLLATEALCKGGLDLAPARDHLIAMLEHPAWRTEVLRALAANDLPLPEATLAQAGSWMASDDAPLRLAAALVVLRAGQDAARALRVLDETWPLVPMKLRIQTMAAAATECPHEDATATMWRRALTSPFSEERTACHKLMKDAAYHDGYLTLLLDSVEQLGPAAAEEAWWAFLDALGDRSEEDARAGADLLAGRLIQWCDADRLPVLRGQHVDSGAWFDLELSPNLIAAMDRCILRDEPTAMRFALGLLRAEVETEDHPETPQLRLALDRLYALHEVPDGIDSFVFETFSHLLEERTNVAPAAIQSLLRRVASTPPDDNVIDVVALLQGHAKRTEMALALVPEFLDAGTRASVEVALSILEASGASAVDHLAALDAFSGRATLTWRERIESCVEEVKEDAAEQAREAEEESEDAGD